MPRGRTESPGPPSPQENHKAIGFLSNTGPDPLGNHNATKPAFNVGPSLVPAKHNLNEISLAADDGAQILFPPLIIQLKHREKKKEKKTTSELDPL